MIVHVIIDDLPYVVLVPESASEDTWDRGVIVGPADLTPLGLSEETTKRLHKELYARNIITALDAQKRRGELSAAIMAALTLDAERVYECYLGILTVPPSHEAPALAKGQQADVVAEKGVVDRG